jgi:hypothetical protein
LRISRRWWFRSRSSGLWSRVVSWWDAGILYIRAATSHWRWRQHGPPKRWYAATTLHAEDGSGMDHRHVGVLLRRHNPDLELYLYCCWAYC